MSKHKRPGYKPKARDEIARNMAAIRSRNNRTELRLRSALHRLGLRFRLHVASLPGRPDIVFPAARVAVFVDGDYWHGRILREGGLAAVRQYYTPTQREYWIPKLQRNAARDVAVTESLTTLGWMVIRFWESDVEKAVEETALQLAAVIREARTA